MDLDTLNLEVNIWLYTVFNPVHFMCECVPSVGEKGKLSINPITGGPAEKAGLRKGDRLLWINGAMACELTHSAINKMVGMNKCLFDNIIRICCK